MELKITSEKENPLLKRKEIHFQLSHAQTGSTPRRLEVRDAIAKAVKTDVNLVFVKRVETRTGTQTALGVAHVYDSIEQARLIEPEYIIKRNVPTEKSKEEKAE